MDGFNFFMDFFCLAGQGVMHILFVSRLTGRKSGIRPILLYVFLLILLGRICLRLAPDGVSAVGAEALLLYGVSRLALGNRRAEALVASILAVYISQLSFGILNSLESVVFPNLIGKPFLYVLLVLATLAALFLCAGCYRAVLQVLSPEPEHRMPYLGLLLFPGLFFFAAELYILYTSYSEVSLVLSPAEVGKHLLLLALQGTGLAALLCTLYAYRGVCRGFRTQAELTSLTQAARAQEVYIAEARMRYERTRAFRHDIQNHLSVLDALLGGGQWEEARAYLGKLKAASASLSFPCRTGNPVVDILLGEKLGPARAEGISWEVSLVLPKSCGIDDLDLCVIFANALDNALHACRLVGGETFIRITGERQGDFYALRFENTCSEGELPRPGTGLSNIRTVAEKYHGAMLTGKADGRFSLEVLLNICVFGGEEGRG